MITQQLFPVSYCLFVISCLLHIKCIFLQLIQIDHFQFPSKYICSLLICCILLSPGKKITLVTTKPGTGYELNLFASLLLIFIQYTLFICITVYLALLANSIRPDAKWVGCEAHGVGSAMVRLQITLQITQRCQPPSVALFCFCSSPKILQLFGSHQWRQLPQQRGKQSHYPPMLFTLIMPLTKSKILMPKYQMSGFVRVFGWC